MSNVLFAASNIKNIDAGVTANTANAYGFVANQYRSFNYRGEGGRTKTDQNLLIAPGNVIDVDGDNTTMAVRVA